MDSNPTLELNSMGLYGLGPEQQPNPMGCKDIKGLGYRELGKGSRVLSLDNVYGF